MSRILILLALALAGGRSLEASAAVQSDVHAAAPGSAAPMSAAPGSAAGSDAHAAPDPRSALLKYLPTGSKVDDLRPSPIPGIYEFLQGVEVSYITADGKYYLDGNVYDLATRANLTESLRARARLALINAVPESQMLIFSPKHPLYTITVFTDVDCPYCRKLHGDMTELNRLGVRVRYLFYPRTGPNTESWRKAEVVWCSADRNDALTQAKLGAQLDMNKTCGPTPVQREYSLGQTIGVPGTPAILTDNGDLINGYMPPKDLLQAIKVAQR